MTGPIPLQTRGPLAMSNLLQNVLRKNGVSLDVHELPLNLVFIGATGQGKSTVINALLGEPLSPVGPVPTTCRSIMFRHGDIRRATITQGCAAVPVDFSDIALHVANSLADEALQIDIPLKTLGQWTLVDTPGISSASSVSSALAAYQNAIVSASAVVLVTSAHRPIGALESEALKFVLACKTRVISVITHSDLIEDESDMRRLTRFHSDHLRRLGFGLVDVVMMPDDIDSLWSAIEAIRNAARLKALSKALACDIERQSSINAKALSSELLGISELNALHARQGLYIDEREAGRPGTHEEADPLSEFTMDALAVALQLDALERLLRGAWSSFSDRERLRRRRHEQMMELSELSNLIVDAGWALGTGQLRGSLRRLRVLDQRKLLLRDGSALHFVLEGILRLGVAETTWLLRGLSEDDEAAKYLEPFLVQKAGHDGTAAA